MIKIANAPCSWGVIEFDLEGEAPDYVQVLNEIAETGYAGTELGDWGFMPN
jgi:inosose dehydratase